MGGRKPIMLSAGAAAPELDFRREALPESDVYSFGIMMSKMLVALEDEAGQKLSWSPKLMDIIIKMTRNSPNDRLSLDQIKTTLHNLSS